MEFVTDILTAVWDLIQMIWGELARIIPIIVKFTLWVIFGIIVLPCVYVAGVLYEPWVKWGERI